jgi:SAM-dependent methyltransferase
VRHEARQRDERARRRERAGGLLVPVALLALSLAACVTKGDQLPRHYDDPEHMIELFESPDRDSWAKPDEVVRALQLDEQGAVIADIGAGSGYFSQRLAREVPAGKVYAVDVDDKFRTYIETHRESWGTPNIEPHLAFYDDPALPEQAVDVVFMSNTYAYLRTRVPYLLKIKEALRPDGRLVVINFKPEANVPGDVAPPAKHRVSKATALSELREAGFVLEREETFLVHQYFLILKQSQP